MTDLNIPTPSEAEPLEKPNITEEKKADTPGQPQGKRLPFFSAYCHMPEGVRFLNQEPSEKIILFLRRHFITNLNWIGLSLILLCLPLFLPLAAEYFSDYFLLIPVPFIIILLGFYYLIIIGYIYLQFISWFYNVGIVTNRQLVDVDFSDIMYRDIAKVRIEDVIDIEFSQGGFLDSIFDFGQVNVQTEGLKSNFEFEEIPNPDRVTDIILELKEKARHA
jgi:hypothetical protein